MPNGQVLQRQSGQEGELVEAKLMFTLQDPGCGQEDFGESSEDSGKPWRRSPRSKTRRALGSSEDGAIRAHPHPPLAAPISLTPSLLLRITFFLKEQPSYWGNFSKKHCRSLREPPTSPNQALRQEPIKDNSFNHYSPRDCLMNV